MLTKNVNNVRFEDIETPTTVTEDYTELDDKTIEEIRSLDYETLFNLKTMCIFFDLYTNSNSE